MNFIERFAAEAELLVGTRFRLHGRVAETGLDCVGLVARALEAAGRRAIAPGGYSLRNAAIDDLLAFAGRNLFFPCHEPLARGDLLLVRPGPAQHHLIIAISRDGFVHAHASLGRVVLHRGPLSWPVLFHWRLAPSSEE